MTEPSIGEIFEPRTSEIPPPSTPRAARTNPRQPYGVDSPHSFFRDLATIARAESQRGKSLDTAQAQGGIALFDGGPIPSFTDGGADEARSRLRVTSERRDLSSTAGAGGEFVPGGGPPVFVAEAFATAARARSRMATILPTRPLPESGLKVQAPRFGNGSAVAVHVENAAVQETDPTTALATGPLGTLAGHNDLSQQALDLSNLDEGIAAELGSAYGERLDIQVINGTGTSGQILGLLAVTGISALIYTSATPTATEAYAQVGKLASSVASAYGAPIDTFIMHPRRRAWIESKLAFTPAWLDVQVVEVGAIPTNLGAGTNEDTVIALAREESPLFLQSPSFRAMIDPLSANLEVRFQIHGYAALLANRQPASIGKSTGTGWASPTF
ncbi:MAG: phage major capsid protein [Actinomycetota bacterium]|nr:phage major capsid protein [Actinomycetota bacterium]